MEDLSLHILDVAENSISSSAGRIEIRINEDAENDVLTIEIKDDGKPPGKRTARSSCIPAPAKERRSGRLFVTATRIASRWAIFKKPYARLLWGILKSPFCMNTRRMVQFIVLIQER
jgi:hypothetical protein